MKSKQLKTLKKEQQERKKLVDAYNKKLQFFGKDDDRTKKAQKALMVFDNSINRK